MWIPEFKDSIVSLHSEFQGNQGYLERNPVSKNHKQNKTKVFKLS